MHSLFMVAQLLLIGIIILLYTLFFKRVFSLLIALALGFTFFFSINSCFGLMMQIFSLAIPFSILTLMNLGLALFLVLRGKLQGKRLISSGLFSQLLLVGTIVCLFASAQLHTGNGKRIHIFSNGYDTATHFNMVRETLTLERVYFDNPYPLSYYFNTAYLVKPPWVLLAGTLKSKQIVTYIMLISLILIVYLVVMSLLYWELLYVKFLEIQKASFWSRILLLSLLFLFFFSETVLKVYVQGHYSQLVGFLPMLSLLLFYEGYLSTKPKLALVDYLVIAGFLAGVSVAYYFLLVPIVCYLYLSLIFKSGKASLIYLGLLTLLLGVTLIPFIKSIFGAYRYLNSVYYIVSVTGGVDSYQLDVLLVLGLGLMAYILFGQWKRKLKIKSYDFLVLSAFFFTMFIISYQLIVNHYLSYAYYKSLFLTVPLVGVYALIGLTLLASKFATLIAFRKARLSHGCILMLVILVVYGWFYFGTRRSYSLAKGYTNFLPSHVYNSALLLIDENPNAKTVLPVMGIIENHWMSYFFSKTQSFAGLTILDTFRYRDMLAYVTKHPSETIVFDPARTIQWNCDRRFFQAQEDKKTFIYPPASAFVEEGRCQKNHD